MGRGVPNRRRLDTRRRCALPLRQVDEEAPHPVHAVRRYLLVHQPYLEGHSLNGRSEASSLRMVHLGPPMRNLHAISTPEPEVLPQSQVVDDGATATSCIDGQGRDC